MGKDNQIASAGIGPSKVLLLKCGKFDFAEVELGLDEAAAVGEAKRCLRCDRAAQE